MSVEDETLKALFAFFGFSRRTCLDPLPFNAVAIPHRSPRSQSPEYAKQAACHPKNSHAVTTIASAIHLSWFDNGCVTPPRPLQAGGKLLRLSPALN